MKHIDIKNSTRYHKIGGYGGRYLVSDQGDIYSLHKGKHLTPKKRDSGRLGTMLYKNGKYKNHTISRLVAKAFVPNPRERKEVHRE